MAWARWSNQRPWPVGSRYQYIADPKSIQGLLPKDAGLQHDAGCSEREERKVRHCKRERRRRLAQSSIKVDHDRDCDVARISPQHVVRVPHELVFSWPLKLDARLSSQDLLSLALSTRTLATQPPKSQTPNIENKRKRKFRF